MSRPLRIFLMTRKQGGDWRIHVSQELPDIVQQWKKRSADSDVSGVLHVGFGRPTARAFDEIADRQVGKLLATQGARYVIPDTTGFSKNPVASVEGEPTFLVIGGWGYSIDDPSPGEDASESRILHPGPAVLSPETRLATGWVAQFLTVAPEFQDALNSAQIFDEASYFDNEAELASAARTASGRFRYDSLIRDPSDPLDIVRCAPPWLRNQKVSQLPLTVRLGNIFNQNNIIFVSDLDQFTRDSIFSLNNFGRHSFKHMVEALEAGLAQGPTDIETPKEGTEVRSISDSAASADHGKAAMAVSLGLMASLLKTLNAIEERDKEILLGRMGFDHPPRTLESLGEEFGITRERIRQIEKRSLEKLIAREIWDDVMRHRLGTVIDAREDPLPLYGLEVVDDWFRGTSEKEDALEYLIDAVCKDLFHVIKVGSVKYVSRVNQEEWNAGLKEARRLLESAVDLKWSEDECRQVVVSLLPEYGQDLAPILWSEASRLCHFTGSGDQRVLTAYGRGMEQLVRVVLQDSDKPLHTSEIALRVGEMTGNQIEESQVRNPTTNVGFLLGRGIYGLRKHVPISDEEMERTAEIAVELVSDGDGDRQWHASELLDEVQEIEGTLSERLDMYGLSVSLHLKSDLKYLGRLVWVAPNADARQRVDIHEAVIGILEAAGGPLSSREINSRLSEFRGVNSTFQIWNREPVLKVDRGLWGLNDRDFDIKRDQQPALVEEVYQALTQKGVGIHLDEISEHVRQSNSISPEAIFSLVTIDERIATGSGQFAYLKEWGETRRTTRKKALEQLMEQLPGPMSIEDIQSWVEFTTERKVERSVLSNALSNLGTKYLGDGIWELEPPEDETDSRESVGLAVDVDQSRTSIEIESNQPQPSDLSEDPNKVIYTESTAENHGYSKEGSSVSSSNEQTGDLLTSTRMGINDQAESLEDLVNYLNRIETAAAGRNMLSPKSQVALNKLKTGDFRLSDSDVNALENLKTNLSRIGVEFDIPHRVE